MADFTNTTGDPIFDSTLRQGLSAQLAQSPFLSLLPDSRIAQILALMTEPKDARLTQKLAREVCQRTASVATIEGFISSNGSQYVLELRAVNCRSGDVLAAEQVTANAQTQVLPAMGDAARNIRRKLGESLASVLKYDAPPRDVTTGSLEARQAYSVGYRAHTLRHDEVAAIPQLQRAVSLDPNFAMAFTTLGACYSTSGEAVRAAESFRRAYALRERVSANEEFYITLSYETNVTGNLEAARKEAGLYTQAYPRDYLAQNVLSNICRFLGEYDKALAAAEVALKLNPQSALIYCTLSNELPGIEPSGRSSGHGEPSARSGRRKRQSVPLPD